jgi:hypothetical protein
MKTFSPKVTIFTILSASSARAFDFRRCRVFNENSFENVFIEVLPYNPDNESAQRACTSQHPQ